MKWQQYAAAWAGQHGGYDLRRGPAPVRAWFGAGYTVARALASLRVSPGAMFVLGLGVAVATPVTATLGPVGLLTAGGLALVTIFLGTLDGALTVLTVGASARAAIRSTVLARLGEVSWLAAFWVVGVAPGLVVACGVVSVVHELARREAIASGLGWASVQTVADRPMRATVAVLGLGLAGLVELVAPSLAAGLLTIAAAVWLLLALFGAGQLTSAVRRSLR